MLYDVFVSNERFIPGPRTAAEWNHIEQKSPHDRAVQKIHSAFCLIISWSAAFFYKQSSVLISKNPGNSRLYTIFPEFPGFFIYADGGNRTRTILRPTDFESVSSASSDTSARGKYYSTTSLSGQRKSSRTWNICPGRFSLYLYYSPVFRRPDL